ncbi:MAG: ABC transporter permease [Ignavibacteriae bacterium]|nr:ABC transporter permease [Ignavibacteriota bacterium]
MFKHYFKSIIREIINRKFYSSIILIGFTLGISLWILIMLWIDYEEKSFGLKNNSLMLYRVSNLVTESSEVWLDSNHVYHYRLFPETPFPLAPSLKSMTPSIVSIARFGYFNDTIVSSGAKSFTEKRFAFADKEFFNFFKFPLISGSISDFSKDSNVVIINKKTADKYFDGEIPVGKKLFINNKYQLKIIAVIKNISSYNKLQFDAIAPISLIKDKKIIDNWIYENVNTYFFVKRKTDITKIIRNINMIMYDENSVYRGNYLVEMIPRHHSYSDIRADAGISGDIQFIYIFSAIAIFIIFIACINYFNISVSQFANRSKEIAIRKTFGSSKKQIVIQYLIEGQLLSFLSLALAIILVSILIPRFNLITSADIQIGFWNNDLLLIKCLIITFLIGLISASYPAFYFSSVNPSRIFSSLISSGAKGRVFRWVISYIQFTVSVALIVSSFKVERQLDYLRNTKMGYDEDYTIQVPYTQSIKNKFDIFKKDMKENPDILDIKISNISGINSNSTESSFLYIKIFPRHIADNIKFIGKIWEKYEHDNLFEYQITDSDMRKEFRSETIMIEIFRYFTFTSFVITLLGFFCISSFMTEQRKTEIAIRKTFGATSLNNYFLLIKEYLLIAFAAIITAHFAVTSTASVWVQRFTYKIGDFQLNEYLVPTVISILLLILTVSFHSVKASRKEPATVLKRE